MLNPSETVFLAALIYEGSESPFTGPATEALVQLGVWPAQILGLQGAYLKHAPPKDPPLPLGTPLPPGATCPWSSAEEVLRREAMCLQKSGLKSATEQG